MRFLLTFLSPYVLRNYELVNNGRACSFYFWKYLNTYLLSNFIQYVCISVLLCVDDVGCCLWSVVVWLLSLFLVGNRFLNRKADPVWSSGLLAWFQGWRQTLNFSFTKLYEYPNIMLQSELAVFVGSTKWSEFMILHIFLEIHVHFCVQFKANSKESAWKSWVQKIDHIQSWILWQNGCLNQQL